MHADVAETIHHRDKPLIIPVLAIGAEGTVRQMVHDQVVSPRSGLGTPRRGLRVD